MHDTKKAVLEYIKTFRAKNGYAPSYREIAAALDIVGASTIKSHIDDLEDAGFVKRVPGVARSVVVLEPDDVAI